MTKINLMDALERSLLTEVRPHVWTVFASDLELPPGNWPRTIIETKLGNGQPFLLRSVNANKATYRQGNGCLTLIIFND